MKDKESAIVEIISWLQAAKTAMGVKTIARTPSAPAETKDFPAIFIHEGDDRITKYSNSSRTGYPATRDAEIVFEIWVNRSSNVKTIYQALRALVFTNKLSTPCAMREVKTFGPFNGGVPHTKTIQFVVGLIYKDDGPFES